MCSVSNIRIPCIDGKSDSSLEGGALKTVDASYPTFPLTDAEIERLLKRAQGWAQINCLCMRSMEDVANSKCCHTAPFSLLPSTFSRKGFEQAQAAQKDFNLLYHYISYDYDFLTECHKDVIKSDDFTKHLYDIYSKVMKEGLAQPLTVSIQRADYMTHQKSPNDEVSLKQVEVNTMAVGAAALASLLHDLHVYMLPALGFSEEQIKSYTPENPAPCMISQGLVNAYKAYGSSTAIVVFIVEDFSPNIFDQYGVEFCIRTLSENSIEVRRVKLTEAKNVFCLDDNKRLLLDKKTEVALVYYRCGYIPEQYPSEEDWDARLLIERSKAIKVPWIGMHLAGTKKVQQVLTREGTVERFLKDSDSVKRVRDTFTKIYGLEENDEGKAGLEALNRMPDGFVLKPQREGGGNNLYGKEIIDHLKHLSWDETAAYILMERIRPPVHDTYMIRPKEPHAKDIVLMHPEVAKCISELGAFGYLIGTPDSVIENVSGGYLHRSKGWNTNEGGLMSGAAVLDSPYLV